MFIFELARKTFTPNSFHSQNVFFCVKYVIVEKLGNRVSNTIASNIVPFALNMLIIKRKWKFGQFLHEITRKKRSFVVLDYRQLVKRTICRFWDDFSRGESTLIVEWHNECARFSFYFLTYYIFFHREIERNKKEQTRKWNAENKVPENI